MSSLRKLLRGTIAFLFVWLAAAVYFAIFFANYDRVDARIISAYEQGDFFKAVSLMQNLAEDAENEYRVVRLSSGLWDNIGRRQDRIDTRMCASRNSDQFLLLGLKQGLKKIEKDSRRPFETTASVKLTRILQQLPNLFATTPTREQAYVLVTAYGANSDPRFGYELVKTLPDFSSETWNSIPMDLKVSAFVARREYDKILKMRHEQLPLLPKAVPALDQSLLTAEVVVHQLQGNTTESQRLARLYLDHKLFTVRKHVETMTRILDNTF